MSKEAAQEEVSRIHRENAERLSGFSEEELLRERERIKQALGWSMKAPALLLSFISSSKGWKAGREGGRDWERGWVGACYKHILQAVKSWEQCQHLPTSVLF